MVVTVAGKGEKCMKKSGKWLAGVCCIMGIFLTSVMPVQAKTTTLEDGTVFDSDYYADTYPDLKAAFGYDYDALLNHYRTYGIHEGRVTSAEAQQEKSGFVSIDNLENKKSLKKKCTDEEFQAAYNVAAVIVAPLTELSREEQLTQIAIAIRNRVDSGQVQYSTSEAHYNDPYGYFVTGVGSCAGCARATGLCLNMLGISYEHVNESQWSHQWCRVNVDGTYWICDAYGLYVGPEPAPYAHPYLQ